MFAADTEAALRAVASLVNSLPDASHSRTDEFTTVDDLRRYLDGWDYTGARAGDAAELEEVRRLREPMRALLTTEVEDLPGAVNAILRDDDAVPQLVEHGQWGWHLHAAPGSAPVAVRIRVETAMALVDLIRRGEAGRVKVCAANGCGAIVVDFSKNRSKRFCDVGNCGNRTNVNAYRARKAGQIRPS